MGVNNPGLVPANNLSDLASASTARTNLGLGTAAVAAIGTSGDTVPKNNTANTFSALQTHDVSAGHQIVAKGFATVSGVGNAANGELRVGGDATNHLRISYEGVSNKRAYIENTYDDANSFLIFRLRTAGGSPVSPLLLSSAGWLPGLDNTFSSGTASFRTSVNYSATGTINTSGGTEKAIRGALSEAELRAWGRVRKHVFQWNDALEKKGEGARLHIGWIAEQVRDAFAAEDLDAARYGLFCSDPVIRKVTRKEKSSRQAVNLARVVCDEIEVTDGCAVLRKVEVFEPRPVFDELPLFDADGARVLDSDGVPTTARIPRMEEVDIEVEDFEPTGEVRLGLRHDQCLILETAYLSAELSALRALLPAH